MYCGVWYGLGGGLLAWLVVVIAVALLAGPVQRIAGLYGSTFSLSGLGLTGGLGLTLSVTGWQGAGPTGGADDAAPGPQPLSGA